MSTPTHYTRFTGLDIHKRTATYVTVDRQGEVLSRGAILMVNLEAWAKEHLSQEDQVVIEATGNAYHVYDQLTPLVGEVQMAHMLGMHDRTCSRKKTDKLDALKLARALASGYVHKIWIPAPEIRAKRELASHRHGLAKHATSLRNQLWGLLYRHGLDLGNVDVLDPAALERVEASSLPEDAKRQWRSNYRLGQVFLAEIAQLDQELARAALQDDQCLRLMTLPGVKAQAALIITSAIGDIERFESSKKLTSYAGLVASVEGSGDKVHYGSITKQGRSLLRWIMVEAANAAVLTPGPIRDRYQRYLRKGKKHNVAIVAIARHLLAIVWHMLKDKQVFRQAREKYLVTKFRGLLRQAHGRCPLKAAPRLVQNVMRWDRVSATT